MAQDFTYPKVAGDYYVRAINQLYPHFRDGVDFSVARDAPGGTYTINDATFGTYIDQARVQEIAEQLYAQDPYAGWTAAAPAITTLAPATAAAGADVQVTVTGTDFVDGCVVTVSGALMATTFVSPTSVTFQTGTGLTAGAKTVTVTNPDAQVSASKAFTVT